MKVRFSENIINLRAENKEEKRVLDEMWENGIVAFGGGAELGICSTKFFASKARLSAHPTTLKKPNEENKNDEDP